MTRPARTKRKTARAEAADMANAEALVVRPNDPDPRTPLVALLVVSVMLLGLRLYATSRVGFGDSEALYASYAAHPQPAYLDHPGLVGLVARVIGDGSVPTPLRTHAVTSFLATLVPWLAYGAARALGAARGRAALGGLVVALVPETAVGLFALTPDLLLAIGWLAAIALAGVGLQAPAGSTRSASAFLAAGLVAGISCAAKVSGLLLVGALAAAYLAVASSKEPARAAVRTVWPWTGLVAGLVVVLPLASFEARTGWPMLHHRLVDTQHGAGVALRNLGALLGGQLAYLSPVFAVFVFFVARDLVRERATDAFSRVLFYAFLIPIVPLVSFCLWSPVAEPHWLAPAFLVLPLHAARRASRAGGALISRRTFLAASGLAAFFTLAVHAWVLIPESARLRPAGTDAKLDIASELYGWPTAVHAVNEQLKGAATPFDPEGHELVVVGPHWTVCAQLEAGLPRVRVGCATSVPDDFDRWLPREQWRRAEHVLFVTDNRYPTDGAAELPGHVQTGRSRVRIMRGGRSARVFELFLYDRRASSSR